MARPGSWWRFAYIVTAALLLIEFSDSIIPLPLSSAQPPPQARPPRRAPHAWLAAAAACVPARLEHLRAAHIASRGAASAASWEPVFEASLAAAGDSLRALSPGDLARVLGAFRGGAQDQERLFGFIHNHGAGPDGEALGIARALSEAASGPSQGGDAVAAGAPPPSLPPPSLPGTVPSSLYDAYVARAVSKTLLGYEGGADARHARFDGLDSRHIMMSLVAFHAGPEPPRPAISETIGGGGSGGGHVVEVGGGFGGWLTLNAPMLASRLSRWTIVDMPHLGVLQRWYLLQQAGVPASLFELVAAANVSSLEEDAFGDAPPIDMLIGAHSLSEMSYETFFDYFARIGWRARHFFYAFHGTSPSASLVALKRELIEAVFEQAAAVASEGGLVANVLYVNRFARGSGGC